MACLNWSTERRKMVAIMVLYLCMPPVEESGKESVPQLPLTAHIVSRTYIVSA